MTKQVPGGGLVGDNLAVEQPENTLGRATGENSQSISRSQLLCTLHGFTQRMAM